MFNRRGFAALLGGTLVAAAISVPATAEAATAPTEVKTIPGDNYLTKATDQPTFAGATGYLHQRSDSTPWLWTRYSDQRTTVVTALAGKAAGSILPAGDDTVFINGTSVRQTLDLNTMALRTVPEPDGTVRAVRVFGDSRVTVRMSGSTATVELHQIAADGSTTPTTVHGLPDGDLSDVLVMAGDASTAVVRFLSSTGAQFGLLDVVSGQIKMLPSGGSVSGVLLSEDRVALVYGGEVRSYSRAGIVSGSDTTADVITMATAASRMGLAGRDVILAPNDLSDVGQVWRFSPGEAEPAMIVRQGSWRRIAQAPDGVLFVGGSGPADWSVRKATAAGQSVVLPLHVQVNAGVTLSSGVLRHIQALVRPGETPAYTHFGFELAPDEAGHSPGVGSGELRGPVQCEADAVCVRTVDGSQEGTSYLTAVGSSVRLMTTTTGVGGMRTIGASTGGTVVDASHEYFIVNGTGPDQQYVLLRGIGDPIITRPVTGAGLWLSTLWTATRAGYLQSKDLFSGVQSAEIATGASCAATEVQATGSLVYWSCGRSGPSGVRVVAQNKNISLPAGQYLLGDNYLVRHDADGSLLRYDLTGGTLGEPATLATFSRGELADDRNISWAVDKFGGDVAWVDSDNTTHIVDPGVAASPLTSFLEGGTAGVSPPSGFSTTEPLTRPVTATSLAIKQVRTGAVTTIAGGSARTTAYAEWNGMIAGKPAVRGVYQWTLSGAVDGQQQKITNGTVEVGCGGTPPLHTYNCDGRPDLLGLTSAATGAGQWFSVQPGGTALANTGSAENLTPITAVVPFGDITKDARADVLIRRSDGSLRAFRGDDGLPFTGNTLTAVAGDWNRWNALIHTGDLTGDGQSDLIARDSATGGLYRIDGDGAGGFKTPVLWALGYTGYTRFVGPGDINGDGHADLLLFVGTDMYAKYGDGKGGLGDRRLVGSGFLGYDAIVGAGDVNEDGKNDLILRDTAGNLYRRLGNGAGDFGNRLLIGTGYQKYAGIY